MHIQALGGAWRYRRVRWTPAARGVRNYIVGEAIGPTKQYRPQDKPQPTKTEDEITAIYAGRRYDD